ncbi:hypothetical protein QEZ52_15890 [Aliisedimentitalea scapharcae]|uniref:Outer membrane protein beta-barrel domain-containing protein n=1 Tax=Aliisedimentitalea scapharcae TaxID=1524259 RepID=A0ABZ2XRW4_9RHOB|nr:hypothetical protein K3727_15815 [Rhodobacteraceae bacterium M382]
MKSTAPYLLSAALLSFGGLVPMQSAANEAAHETLEAESGPHIVELFIGSTYADHHGHREHAFSIGGQYRYALSHRTSVGVLAEYATESLDAWVVGIPLVVNLGDTRWQLTAMPGAEIEGGNTEFLFRAGVGYEFEMEGGYSIKPEINVDWVDGEASVVTGLSFGWRF